VLPSHPHILDSTVDHTGQVVGTAATFAIAVAAIGLVVWLCRRERVTWPLVALAGGTLTCLLEPLFDHLYGLWFPSRGEWTLFTTYGVHEPVWLPAAYLVVYGALPVYVVKRLDRAPTLRTVWQLYGMLVVIALVAEITYIKVLGLYNYQFHQPFVVLGYPAFLGFVNSMSALIAGLAMWRLVPLLRGSRQLLLFALPPLAFGVDAVGSGFIYLALRNANHPSDFLIHVSCLTVAAGGALTVRLLAMMLPDGAPVSTPASAARVDSSASEPERDLIALGR
jgi:hypothetical protein